MKLDQVLPLWGDSKTSLAHDLGIKPQNMHNWLKNREGEIPSCHHETIRGKLKSKRDLINELLES